MSAQWTQFLKPHPDPHPFAYQSARGRSRLHSKSTTDVHSHDHTHTAPHYLSPHAYLTHSHSHSRSMQSLKRTPSSASSTSTSASVASLFRVSFAYKYWRKGAKPREPSPPPMLGPLAFEGGGWGDLGVPLVVYVGEGDGDEEGEKGIGTSMQREENLQKGGIVTPGPRTRRTKGDGERLDTASRPSRPSSPIPIPTPIRTLSGPLIGAPRPTPASKPTPTPASSARARGHGHGRRRHASAHAHAGPQAPTGEVRVDNEDNNSSAGDDARYDDGRGLLAVFNHHFPRASGIGTAPGLGDGCDCDYAQDYDYDYDSASATMGEQGSAPSTVTRRLVKKRTSVLPAAAADAHLSSAEIASSSSSSSAVFVPPSTSPPTISSLTGSPTASTASTPLSHKTKSALKPALKRTNPLLSQVFPSTSQPSLSFPSVPPLPPSSSHTPSSPQTLTPTSPPSLSPSPNPHRTVHYQSKSDCGHGGASATSTAARRAALLARGVPVSVPMPVPMLVDGEEGEGVPPVQSQKKRASLLVRSFSMRGGTSTPSASASSPTSPSQPSANTNTNTNTAHPPSSWTKLGLGLSLSSGSGSGSSSSSSPTSSKSGFWSTFSSSSTSSLPSSSASGSESGHGHGTTPGSAGGSNGGGDAGAGAGAGSTGIGAKWRRRWSAGRAASASEGVQGSYETMQRPSIPLVIDTSATASNSTLPSAPAPNIITSTTTASPLASPTTSLSTNLSMRVRRQSTGKLVKRRMSASVDQEREREGARHGRGHARGASIDETSLAALGLARESERAQQQQKKQDAKAGRRAKFTLGSAPASEVDLPSTLAPPVPPPPLPLSSSPPPTLSRPPLVRRDALIDPTDPAAPGRRRWTLAAAITDEAISDVGLVRELERMRVVGAWDRGRRRDARRSERERERDGEWVRVGKEGEEEQEGDGYTDDVWDIDVGREIWEGREGLLERERALRERVGTGTAVDGESSESASSSLHSAPSPSASAPPASSSTTPTSWLTAQRALLTCRELILTERHYLALLRTLLASSTSGSEIPSVVAATPHAPAHTSVTYTIIGPPAPPLMLHYAAELERASAGVLDRMVRAPSVGGVARAFLDGELDVENAYVRWCGVVGGWFVDGKGGADTNASAVAGESEPSLLGMGLVLRRRSSRTALASSTSNLGHGDAESAHGHGSTSAAQGSGTSSSSPLKRTVGTWRKSMPSVPSLALGQGEAHAYGNEVRWRREEEARVREAKKEREREREREKERGREAKKEMKERERERTRSRLVAGSTTQEQVAPPQTRPVRKLAVRDLAILPTQRVMRYVLLYRDLLSHTPTSSTSRVLVERALEAACRIADKCDRAQGNAAFMVSGNAAASTLPANGTTGPPAARSGSGGSTSSRNSRRPLSAGSRASSPVASHCTTSTQSSAATTTTTTTSTNIISSTCTSVAESSESALFPSSLPHSKSSIVTSGTPLSNVRGTSLSTTSLKTAIGWGKSATTTKSS